MNCLFLLRRRLVAALALCAAAGGLSAAPPDRIVTIGAEDDWAPYAAANADQTAPEGITVDIVRAALRSQGIELRFSLLPFGRCMLYTETGRLPACFNAIQTDENRGQFVWHRTPLLHEPLAVFARTETPGSGLREQDLEGRLVGLTIGYNYPTSLMNNERIRKTTVKSDTQLLALLVVGRVDYVLLGAMSGYCRARQMGPIGKLVKVAGTLRNDGVMVAFSRARADGAQLAERLDRGLEAIRASGEYDRIVAPLRTIPPSDAEMDALPGCRTPDTHSSARR